MNILLQEDMRITNSLSSTEAVAKMAAKYPDRANVTSAVAD